MVQGGTGVFNRAGGAGGGGGGGGGSVSTTTKSVALVQVSETNQTANQTTDITDDYADILASEGGSALEVGPFQINDLEDVISLWAAGVANMGQGAADAFGVELRYQRAVADAEAGPFAAYATAAGADWSPLSNNSASAIYGTVFRSKLVAGDSVGDQWRDYSPSTFTTGTWTNLGFTADDVGKWVKFKAQLKRTSNNSPAINVVYGWKIKGMVVGTTSVVGSVTGSGGGGLAEGDGVFRDITEEGHPPEPSEDDNNLYFNRAIPRIWVPSLHPGADTPPSVTRTAIPTAGRYKGSWWSNPSGQFNEGDFYYNRNSHAFRYRRDDGHWWILSWTEIKEVALMADGSTAFFESDAIWLSEVRDHQQAAQIIEDVHVYDANRQYWYMHGSQLYRVLVFTAAATNVLVPGHTAFDPGPRAAPAVIFARPGQTKRFPTDPQSLTPEGSEAVGGTGAKTHFRQIHRLAFNPTPLQAHFGGEAIAPFLAAADVTGAVDVVQLSSGELPNSIVTVDAALADNVVFRPEEGIYDLECLVLAELADEIDDLRLQFLEVTSGTDDVEIDFTTFFSSTISATHDSSRIRIYYPYFETDGSREFYFKIEGGRSAVQDITDMAWTLMLKQLP